jgi:hypothetical protein
MANITEQWSQVHTPTGRTSHPRRLPEHTFGMIFLVLLILLAIAASLLLPGVDVTTADFLVGP